MRKTWVNRFGRGDIAFDVALSPAYRPPATLTGAPQPPIFRPRTGAPGRSKAGNRTMKVKSSLKSAKRRHRACRVVRRRGRIYVINKRNRRFKARQG